MKKKLVRNGYESLLILVLVGIGSVLFACCSSSSTPQRKTALRASPTPEMLIVRPTNTPTPPPTRYPIIQTMTAAVYAPLPEATPFVLSATPTKEYHQPQNIYSPTPNRLGSAGSSDRTCRIKGNVSGSNKIYHCPNWRDYDRTDIDPSEGDRWFCSEAEAQAAGFRRPKNIGRYEHCRP